MIDREVLTKEIEAKYAELQKLGLKHSLDDFDKIFQARDLFIREGFVRDQFDRALCDLAANIMNDWTGFLHAIVMPNPQSMIWMAEHHFFAEREREEMVELMNKIIAFTTKITEIRLTNDQKAKIDFLNDSVPFWNDVMAPHLLKIANKRKAEWDKKKDEPVKFNP
ncbi:MAG: hypothetical protein ACE5FT_05105 [Candidatus Nanoarchaeia archaeon]